MSNTSATGGYISPVVPSSALFDDALDALLQQMVAGITGLPGAMVRPRWQTVVPKQPEPSADWCAIGITDITSMDYPAEMHDGTGDGSDTQQQWGEFSMLASFYGPNGHANASLLRRGIYVAQNREALQSSGIDLVDAGKVTTAPDLVNQQWVKRRDITLRFRRIVETVYPVMNILDAPFSVVSDHP